MLWILSGLMACDAEPDPVLVRSYEFDAEDQHLPVAPWDPVALSVWRVCETDPCGEGVGPTCQETQFCWDPGRLAVDVPVALQDLATPNGGRVYAEVPLEEWPVGPIEVVGSIDGEEALVLQSEVLAGVNPEPGVWKVDGG